MNIKWLKNKEGELTGYVTTEEGERIGTLHIWDYDGAGTLVLEMHIGVCALSRQDAGVIGDVLVEFADGRLPKGEDDEDQS